MTDVRRLGFVVLCAACGSMSGFSCDHESPPVDPCRRQCELHVDPCDERPFEEFPAFDAARDEWWPACADRAEGRCAEGTLILWEDCGYGLAGARFYDADSGAFIALWTRTDANIDPCGAETYWPIRVECNDPVVTGVFQGSLLEVDDRIGYSGS